MRSLLISVLFLMIVVGGAQAESARLGPSIETLVDRVTWGRTSESVATAKSLGADRWLETQLSPTSPAQLPAPVQAQIDALRISRTPTAQLATEMESEAKAAALLQDPPARQSAQKAYQMAMRALREEITTRSLLRDLYSPAQLQEQMSWFWANHFNILAEKRDIRTMLADYEDSAIRPHALGKFRDLLKAADMHPAMLRYLDNDQNTTGRVNENFAREILELHTMGVGSGYTQKDVEEMARVLTGVGVSLASGAPKLKPEQQQFYVRRGLMEFNPTRHDFGTKTILGRQVAGKGLPELEQTLDLLASHPATARHISAKLALYFMDDAPPRLIDRMATAFLRTDGDIASVLRVLFKSSEFNASLGKKIKDPIHYTVSAIRLAYGDRPISSTMPLQIWIGRMGQSLYGHETPDGYPLESSAWSGPGQLTNIFEVARQVGSGTAGLFKPNAEGAQDQSTLPQLQNAQQASTQAQLSDTTRTVLAQARSPGEWNTLFLSSPEFLHR